MAIKDIGGVIVDTAAAGHISEAAGTPIAARLREVGAQVHSAQDAMFDVVADLEARWTTSNIAIDTDGTPYISPGSMTTRVLIDSDGTPYVAGVGA